MESLNFIKMEKKYKKIVIILVFLTLAIALVYGADIDKIKIEKVKLEDGTIQYYIYILSEVTTDKKIDDKINELNNVNFDFDDCIRLDDLKSIDCEIMNEKDLEKCREAWRMFCEAEEYMINQNIELEIEELNKKKIELEKIK